MLKSKISQSFDSAIRSKRERLATTTADILLKSLEKRGFALMNPLPLIDEDDIVGLIGEMLVKEIAVQRGFEPVFVKFEATGSSKSRGIDLVVRRFDRTWELTLVEAKHLHQAVKGKSKADSPAEIRKRFNDGLDEFEHERTIANIALIIIALIHAARTARGAAAEVPGLDAKISFLIGRLMMEDYSLEVATCIDSKYCEQTTLDVATQSILKREEVGPHEVRFCLLKTDGLELYTSEACDEYA